jgi:hypothetical protein
MKFLEPMNVHFEAHFFYRIITFDALVPGRQNNERLSEDFTSSLISHLFSTGLLRRHYTAYRPGLYS